MLDKLVDLLVSFVKLAKFWYVIEPYETAVVTTFGRPTRDIGPRDGLFRTGLHLILPLNVEVVEEISTQKDTANLIGQDLLMSDGIQVRCNGVFRYAIRAERVREYVFGVGIEDAFVRDHLQAAIAAAVGVTPAQNLDLPALEALALRKAREFLNDFGLKIYSFHFVSFVKVGRSYRLITGP